MLRYRNLTRLRRVLLFKDSEGGTWPFELADFKRSCICRHAPLKKTDRSALIVPWNSPLNNNSVPPLARPLNLVGPRDFDRVGRAPSRPTFQSFRIADCGFGAAFSNGPSAGPLYDLEAISNCGTGIRNFRLSDFGATGNLVASSRNP
jgi:hypothetical protein